MAMFNSYVKLPEDILQPTNKLGMPINILYHLTYVISRVKDRGIVGY